MSLSSTAIQNMIDLSPSLHRCKQSLEDFVDNTKVFMGDKLDNRRYYGLLKDKIADGSSVSTVLRERRHDHDISPVGVAGCSILDEINKLKLMLMV